MPHHLSILFRARPPLEYAEPIKKGKCKPLRPLIDKTRDFLQIFEDSEPPKKVEVEKTQDRKERLKREKLVQHLMKQKEEIKKYDPRNDPNAKGDEQKTIFVARLSRKTDEQRLKKEFELFGPIKRLRVVVDQKEGKPRGYAFIEFERSQDANIAYQKGDGRRVDGKRVLVDFERGRVKKDWLPRRLGGGKGDTRRNREEEKLIRELQKTHPLLREKSRSRSRDKTNGNGIEESKAGSNDNRHHNRHNEKKERSKSKEKVGEKHRGRDNTPKKSESKAAEEVNPETHRDDRGDKKESRRDTSDKKDHRKKDKKDKKDKRDKKDKKKKDKKKDKKEHHHKKETSGGKDDEAEPGEISD